MAFALDHVFILTGAGAPEAEDLIRFGLVEGTPNVHPGQGTANRRFFFRNAMLELLWVNNPEEVRSVPARQLSLWERWQGRARDASPFGICLRPVDPDTDELPFPGFEYRPPYLPEPRSIHVAESPLIEPLLFHLTFGKRPDAELTANQQPLEHRVPLGEVTALRTTLPSSSLSPAARAVQKTGLVAFLEGRDHCLEIGFDGEMEGRVADFRPTIPLVLSW